MTAALTRPRAAEIIAFDNVLVVYKFVGDLHFYATADGEENEIVLSLVLSALVDTVSLLLTCVSAAGAVARGAAHALGFSPQDGGQEERAGEPGPHLYDTGRARGRRVRRRLSAPLGRSLRSHVSLATQHHLGNRPHRHLRPRVHARKRRRGAPVGAGAHAARSLASVSAGAAKPLRELPPTQSRLTRPADVLAGAGISEGAAGAIAAVLGASRACHLHTAIRTVKISPYSIKSRAVR